MNNKNQQSTRIQQALEWLNKEVEKDKVEVENHKLKMIEELKKIKKEEMFVIPEKPKTTFFKKILKIFGF